MSTKTLVSNIYIYISVESSNTLGLVDIQKIQSNRKYIKLVM